MLHRAAERGMTAKVSESENSERKGACPLRATTGLSVARLHEVISTYWSGFHLNLKRFDLNLAEFDGTRPVLQRDRPFVEHAVAQLCRCLAIENHGNVASVRRDFVCIPFSTGFWHRINFNVSGDCAGAVTWIGTLVENIGFVAGSIRDFLGVEAPEINAAVSVVACHEFDPNDEVFVRVLGDQIPGLFFVSHRVGYNGTVCDVPI